MERLRRVERAWLAARAWATQESRRRWFLLGAATVFAVLAFVSFKSLPEGVELRPLFMVVIALVGAPATLLLNALEYRTMARALGHAVGLNGAARVSVAATLANYLPVPGGVAVRVAALKGHGSPIGLAVSINAVAGAIWLGATGLLVGVAMLATPERALGGIVTLLAGTAVLFGTAVVLQRRAGPGWRSVFVALFAIETGTALITALRVALALAAIGQSVTAAGAVTIGSAQVIAAAIGIFPAGLGLREALAAGLATTVDVPAAVAVAASAVDRAAALVGMAACAPLLGVRLQALLGRARSDRKG